MTMVSSAPHTIVRDPADGDDPVLAAFRRARRRPPMPDEERRRMVALAEQATGRQSNAQFMEKLARYRAQAK